MQKQIPSRFTIAISPNFSFSRMPGGSFSVRHSPYDLKQTQILSIERVESDKLKIKFRTSEGDEHNAYIRSKNNVGTVELDIVEKHAKELINKSYDALIYLSFTKI